CESNGEANQADDTQQDDIGRAGATDPRPEREAARDLEERGEREHREVGAHSSSNAWTNSRVPGGPLSSRKIGPSSGSTAIAKRRNRQHWRSASTARAIVESVSAVGANRRRYPSGNFSRCSACLSKS